MPKGKGLALGSGGPDSTLLAVGLTTLVCWGAGRGFYWIQHLFAGHAPTLWHPAGVGVALLLLWGYRVWPGIALAALLTVYPLLNSPAYVVVAAAGALLDALGTAFLTRLFSRGRFHPALDRIADVAVLVSATFLVTAVRSGVRTYFLGGPPVEGWIRWLVQWHGAALGIILFAPVVLVWTQPGRARAGHPAEAAALAAGLALIGVGAFVPMAPALALSMVYLVFPLLAWAALRFQQRGAVTAGAIAASVALLSAYGGHTLLGGGPAALDPFALWFPMEISVVSALFISATVTERERALHGVRQLATVLEETTDLVATADRGGNLQFMNRAGRRLLGIGEGQDLAGITISDLHPPDDAQVIESTALPQAVATGTWRGETVFRALDGREIPFSQVVVARKNDLGEVTHFATIGRDLAQQKEQEARLRQAQKMDAIGRLAAGVAHDFNNLLTIIRGNCEAAADRAHGEVREALTEIEDAAKRASELTAQLLAFSRKQVTRPQTLDLNAALDGCQRLVGRLIGKHVQLEFRPGANAGCVTMDPGLLHQIVLNLAVNARDAMPEGGTLTIGTERVTVETDSGKSGFQVPAGEYVLLAVSDSGVGIAKEVQPHVFDPFFTTKDPGQGTGLGLATVYGIVKQSNGFILVESEPGAGATFRIYFPPSAASAEKERIPETKPAAAGLGQAPGNLQGAVLLVEDEDQLRELLRRTLVSRGYQVVTASSGDKGLAFCRESNQAPELLVSDLNMPGMSGMELSRQIRAQSPEVKVLFITGYTDERAIREGKLPPGVWCLQKPFDLAVFTRQVREILGR